MAFLFYILFCNRKAIFGTGPFIAIKAFVASHTCAVHLYSAKIRAAIPIFTSVTVLRIDKTHKSSFRLKVKKLIVTFTA